MLNKQTKKKKKKRTRGLKKKKKPSYNGQMPQITRILTQVGYKFKSSITTYQDKFSEITRTLSIGETLGS